MISVNIVSCLIEAQILILTLSVLILWEILYRTFWAGLEIEICIIMRRSRLHYVERLVLMHWCQNKDWLICVLHVFINCWLSQLHSFFPLFRRLERSTMIFIILIQVFYLHKASPQIILVQFEATATNLSLFFASLMFLDLLRFIDPFFWKIWSIRKLLIAAQTKMVILLQMTGALIIFIYIVV